MLVFGCWLMNHVIYLKYFLLLLKAEQIHKIFRTPIFTQNYDFFQNLQKKVSFLSL